MALPLKNVPDGWQHQAERLALNHTAVAATVVAATTEQVRRRPLLRAVPNHSELGAARPDTSQTESTNERGAKRAVFTQPERQAAREAAAEWILNARRETLAARAARAAAADKRIGDLEADLELARERIAFLQNENHSLQSSLDITAKENSRLSDRVEVGETACYRARSQLEQTQSILAATEVERDRLTSVSNEASARLEQIQAALTATEAERDKLASVRNETRARLQKARTVLSATEAERDQLVSAGNQARAGLRQSQASLAATEAECAKLGFAVNEARIELEQTRTTLAATEADRVTLSLAVDEANEKRRIETDTVNARLAVMTERAITAEKLLITARHRLLASTA